ncbi:MAG: hypothetical protein HYW50_01420 [Candidatus Diapherotrites archaeon]|nr:hypothetical protein [Candidatus Diapherotrites archaeon]
MAAHDEVLGTKDLIKSAKELLEKEAEHKNLLEEQKKISEQVEKLGFLEKETRDARNSQTSLREKIYGLEMEMKISGELIEQLKENEKRLIAAKNSIKEIEETAKRLSKTIEQVTIFVNVLKETQALLRYSLINTVNEAMNDIWQNIYPYGDFESAKIEINETGNYEIMVKQKMGSGNGQREF